MFSVRANRVMLYELLLIFVLNACSDADYWNTGRVLYGKDGSIDEYPFFGLILPARHLYFNRSGDHGFQVHCGGAFITPVYFLSAFHCFMNHEKLKWVVVTGVRNRCLREENGGIFRVDRILLNPKSEISDMLIADIALARVSDHVFEIGTLRLPSSDIFPGLMATVVGFGVTRMSRRRRTRARDLPCVIQETYMYVPYPAHCKKPPSYVEGSFCAKSLGGKASTACRGDSGGPLFTEDENDDKVIIGISSFGERFCDTANADDHYTNVYQYVPWIVSAIHADGGVLPQMGGPPALTID